HSNGMIILCVKEDITEPRILSIGTSVIQHVNKSICSKYSLHVVFEINSPGLCILCQKFSRSIAKKNQSILISSPVGQKHFLDQSVPLVHLCVNQFNRSYKTLSGTG